MAQIAKMLIGFENILMDQQHYFSDKHIENIFYLIMGSCLRDETMAVQAFNLALDLLGKYRLVVGKKIALEIIELEKYEMATA